VAVDTNTTNTTCVDTFFESESEGGGGWEKTAGELLFGTDDETFERDWPSAALLPPFDLSSPLAPDFRQV